MSKVTPTTAKGAVRVWLLCVILPFTIVLLVDQCTKAWASALIGARDYGPIFLRTVRNYGFMLGSLSELPAAVTVILPAVVGAFLIYLFFVFQYFLPIKSSALRVGMSLVFGGFLGNVCDRIYRGYVVDFMQLDTHLMRTAFNVADVCQWVGAGVLLLCFVLERHVLYPPDERRGRKWIEPGYQRRYCFTLVLLGLAFSIMTGIVSFAFLKISLEHLSEAKSERIQAFLFAYVQVHFAVSAFFLLSLFIVGLYLSHRVVGPIKRFEVFLEDLLKGKVSDVRLRQHDEFQRLQALALRYHMFFHERLGLPKPPLNTGTIAPASVVRTRAGEAFDFREALGKQKVWIMFLRYSTCPLCACYLDDIRSLIATARSHGVGVYAVYEDAPSLPKDDRTTSTLALLDSLEIPVLLDPERTLYGYYRTNSNTFAAFFPRIVVALVKARLRGYKQGRITGRLGTLPAHFFVSADGRIAWMYYGTNLLDHPPEDKIMAFIAPRGPGTDIAPNSSSGQPNAGGSYERHRTFEEPT